MAILIRDSEAREEKRTDEFFISKSLEVITVFYIIFLIILSICLILVFISDRKTTKQLEEQKVEKEKKLIEQGYVRPTFKYLSQEQIDDIHARGKITPAEKVKEWEGMDLCAPGDAIGSAAWRCEKFHNCHDCLVDYANEHDEYTSFCEIIKLCSPYKLYGCKEKNGEASNEERNTANS